MCMDMLLNEFHGCLHWWKIALAFLLAVHSKWSIKLSEMLYK